MPYYIILLININSFGLPEKKLRNIDKYGKIYFSKNKKNSQVDSGYSEPVLIYGTLRHPKWVDFLPVFAPMHNTNSC